MFLERWAALSTKPKISNKLWFVGGCEARGVWLLLIKILEEIGCHHWKYKHAPNDWNRTSDRQNNLILCAETDLSRLLSLSCSQTVLPVAVSYTFQWALCPDTQKYPGEELCKSTCSVKQKVLELCHQIKTISFKHLGVEWLMNMPLCQQQKEIKENNLKLKSATSENPGGAESLQIYRREQKKIYT